ncbi:F196B protein, partial [Furnarius figulus]|nr:F196B protein [Furnarius figulus]
MAQQNMRMRPVLLKRNSLDSADFLRPPQHRRTKSQQVRFKEDGVGTKAELDADPSPDTAFPPAKPEIFRDPRFLLTPSPTFPRAPSGLRNIAIQTSPSLRKHFPVFKRKKLAASKSLTEMPTEPAHALQVNGNLCEQDVLAADLCYLRISNHGEDGAGNSERGGHVSQRPPKAQSNGPIYSDDFSVSEKTTASTQVPEYIHVSFPQGRNVSMDAPDTTTNPSSSLHCSAAPTSAESNENSALASASERAEPCPSIAAKCSEGQPCPAAPEGLTGHAELPCASRDASKDAAPLPPPSNHSSPPRPPRDCHQAGEHKLDSSRVMDPTAASLTSSNAPKPGLSCRAETERSPTQADVSQCDSCLEGFHIKSYPPRNEINPQPNKEISEINQIHLAHGELCALQGRLQSVEESLQSNQEKIKVLLNVIQDLEKSRALSEGRNFYHTGQDLNNCSTCQNTACIIYSVEYDFRQQEGRFHQILKTLDHAEQDPAPASPQKPPPEPPAPEKKELRRKPKKMKRKCFWWI